jgi:hypothetical protein
MGNFCLSFACIPSIYGVHQDSKLIELWRVHDSTGLRAEANLKHTALAVRVAWWPAP